MPTAEITIDEHGIPVDSAGHYAFPLKTFADRKRNVAQIVWCIYYDGPFEDPQGGMCTSKLNEALGRRRVIISHQNLNTILKDMDHPGAKYGHLIERNCPPGGKRTYRIASLHDPHEVPFPPNPWPHEAKATFEPRGGAKPVVDRGADDEHTELEETFTRQARRRGGAANGRGLKPPVDVMARLYEADRELKAKAQADVADLSDLSEFEADDGRVPDIVAAVEEMIEETPSPEPEPEVEPKPETGPTNGLVPVERAPAVPIGGSDDAFDLAGLDLDSEPTPPASGYADLLTRAIQNITDAITIKATEEANRHEDVGLIVDERMAAYIRLNDENAALRSKLARSVQREQELLSLIRALKATVSKLRGAQ